MAEKRTVSRIGERIRKRRENLGLSLSQLSIQAGVSKAFLWEIEKGNARRPGAEVLMRVASTLKCTIAELMGENKPNDNTIEPEINAALKEFIAERRKIGRPLEKEEVDSLAYIQFRGKRPQSKEDWEEVYFILRNRTKDEDDSGDE